MCALRISANVSYAHASEDLAILTGISVSSKTQQRLVHRQTFSPPSLTEGVTQLSLDGGNIRLTTPKGQPCHWRGYKAVRINGDRVGLAYYSNRQFNQDAQCSTCSIASLSELKCSICCRMRLLIQDQDRSILFKSGE